jgi:hypothetical protein
LTMLGKSANIRQLKFCKVNINNEHKRRSTATDNGNQRISKY